MAARTKIWVAVLVGLVLAQTAASLLMERGKALTIVSDLIQARSCWLRRLLSSPISRARAARVFNPSFLDSDELGDALLAGLPRNVELLEVLKRQDVPEPFLGDVVLFLHLVPMIAALAVLPHLREDERDERVRMLDFALLLIWWVFIYVYAVIPWQSVQVDEPTYSANFNFAYLTEKLVLLVALAVLAYTARPRLAQLYGQLLGASALYASSSYVATWAIGRKLYYSGSIYDIPLTVSMAWMAAVPLLALRIDLSDPSLPSHCWACGSHA